MIFPTDTPAIMKEKEERAERIALENAQKDALKARTELAKLQAK